MLRAVSRYKQVLCASRQSWIPTKMTIRSSTDKPKPTPIQKPKIKLNQESFLNGTFANYIEQMYDSWLQNPSSVHHSWAKYFAEEAALASAVGDPTIATNEREVKVSAKPVRKQDPQLIQGDFINPEETINLRSESAQLQKLLFVYRDSGHLMANVDPLDMSTPFGKIKTPDYKRIPNEIYKNFAPRLNFPDMNKHIALPEDTVVGDEQSAMLNIGEFIKRLEAVYCGPVGVEINHIKNVKRLRWLKTEIEKTNFYVSLDKDEKILLWKNLLFTHHLEQFCHKKWPSEKRFSIEGCDVLVPACNFLIHECSKLGVDTLVFGSAHRGRLNLLTNIVHAPVHDIFTRFMSLEYKDTGDGDVKYHLGAYVKYKTPHNEKPVNLTLSSNPSHLEAVYPVNLGKTKAFQFLKNDPTGEKIVHVSLHGDAAFSGEGVIYECVQMAKIEPYNVHGTIHVIINNQVGFTANPWETRSSMYTTCVAKVIGAPVFHVNADEPEAVVSVMKLIARYRQTFKRDAFIDIIGYRRHGHNEGDDPSFTQPLMYEKIKKTPPIFEKYTQKLLNEGVITQEMVNQEVEAYQQKLEAEYDRSRKADAFDSTPWIDVPWEGFDKNKQLTAMPKTGGDLNRLQSFGKLVSQPPPEPFKIHRSLQRVLNQRNKMIEENSLDWAMAEALAFASILDDGNHIRLIGQDSKRGTFSHRHAVYHDQVSRNSYTPLEHVGSKQGKFDVYNSILNEMAALSFEFGYSLVDPNLLVIWEAQFGDFANNAQSVFDQWISSADSKWNIQSGLVMFLPHGVEGQGPEHSSARPERFLELCSDSPRCVELDMKKQLFNANWFILHPSTPSTLFHALRRQLQLPFRRPLVVCTPKSLLRHPQVKCTFEDLSGDTKFQAYLPETSDQRKDKVLKYILCSGKMYYDLIDARDKANLNDKIAIARLEQISPFPYLDFIEDVSSYKNLTQICWCQSEPENFGFWKYVGPRMCSVMEISTHPVCYIGRDASSVPASGISSKYKQTQEYLIDDAMSIDTSC
ncbi:hypothetical protein WDU94_007835 [Cyamophila willieti]